MASMSTTKRGGITTTHLNDERNTRIYTFADPQAHMRASLMRMSKAQLAEMVLSMASEIVDHRHTDEA